MVWWAWMVLGLCLLIAEMVTPGLFLLFFGVGALVVGFLDLAGVGGPAWMQWVIFSASSIVSMLMFREPLLKRLKQRETGDMDKLDNEFAVAMEEIAADAMGKAELRGSPWSAKNVGAATIARGQRCRVESVDGLMLRVRLD
ncbi:MAG TPA: NfeD family protein [Terriglobales bacterium]|nr:NfeD family protein [Terriglobales bacterium]